MRAVDGFRILLVLVSCLPVRALAATPASQDTPAAAPGVEFLMPADGAFIPGGPVFVAGRLPAGVEWVNLLVDGRPAGDITREGRGFWLALSPAAGSHEVEARAGEFQARLRFVYGVGGRGSAPYRYHKPVLEDRCAECHAGMKRPSPTAEAETCKHCHRSLAVMYPYVHGPVAVGKCLVCHDPHGSSHTGLTRREPLKLCTSCHDQPASMQHVQTSRSRVCFLCHNPHASMNRRLLYDIVK